MAKSEGISINVNRESSSACIIGALLPIFAGMIVCSGCDTMSFPSQPTNVNRRVTAPPAVTVKESRSGGASAVVKPGFVIRIAVMASGKKEMEDSEKRISDNGDVTLQLLGTVHVAGLTLDELKAKLNTLYGEYFNQPQVVVDFVKDSEQDGASPWGSVTVMGRVVRPGRIPIPPTRDLTVSGAIQQCGGFSTSARDDAIRISRRKSDGTAESFDVNLKAAGANGQLEEDKALQSGDVIFVPEKRF
jgi:polysaccharide biosynthesis/export protein